MPPTGDPYKLACAISYRAEKMLALVTEWDEEGDGQLSAKEFRQATALIPTFHYEILGNVLKSSHFRIEIIDAQSECTRDPDQNGRP